MLLAVLTSYSYDFECLLETEGCRQQQSFQTEAADSHCSQPSLMPVAVAILPTHTRLVVPAVIVTLQHGNLWITVDAPAYAPFSVPLGLRAPPNAV
jgi:hypothetical protein